MTPTEFAAAFPEQRIAITRIFAKDDGEELWTIRVWLEKPNCYPIEKLFVAQTYGEAVRKAIAFKQSDFKT